MIMQICDQAAGRFRIKPFLYALAIEEWLYTRNTCEASSTIFSGFGYVPAKNRGRDGTPVPWRKRLTWSVNEVAAYLIKQTTPQRFADFISR